MAKHPHRMTSLDAIMAGVDKGTRLARMFNALCEHPYGLSGFELMNIIYADDEDGGPDWPTVNVRVHQFNVEAKLKNSPFRIHTLVNGRPGKGGGSGLRYRLWVRRVKPNGHDEPTL